MSNTLSLIEQIQQLWTVAIKSISHIKAHTSNSTAASNSNITTGPDNSSTVQLNKSSIARPADSNIDVCYANAGDTIEIQCQQDKIPELCSWLFTNKNYNFAGLIVEENKQQWDLFYLFTSQTETKRILIRASSPVEACSFKSVSLLVHAADWHEREAEDLFGLVFEGHPHLGDFILHDDVWQERVEPMRDSFNPDNARSNRNPRKNWQPRRIVNIPGAFIMPVGPIFAGGAESVNFQLETIGEEILRAFPRLFYKYRGVEKIAQGRTVSQVNLLAERFAGTTAFSFSLAFCMAIEQICNVKPPERVQILRVFLAELERLRHHIGTIEAICSSTGLIVAANQAAILEEQMLRITCTLTGHRYSFGMNIPGGLSCDITNEACNEAMTNARSQLKELNKLENMLINTSSFLDRLEQVGTITGNQARNYGMVGPVARGSGCCNDLRKTQPYCVYDKFDFELPCEHEGDGYARLRVWFAEARQALKIMQQAINLLPNASAKASDTPPTTALKTVPGVAVAGVETPRGASWHWVHIGEDGKIKRYKLITPSFVNWHGFHMAVENFAFQDFPIILATFGLSVAENDR